MNLKKKCVKDYLFVCLFVFTQILCNLIFKCLVYDQVIVRRCNS